MSAQSTSKPLLQIGPAAERAGLSIRTVRYWEEVGLVRPSGRTFGGFRLYSDSDVERLLTVKRMKPFDLTLAEMRELLELLESAGRPTRECRDAEERLAYYAERSHERARKLEAYLDQARALREQVINCLDELGKREQATRSDVAR